jgi:hypothetical protein
MWRAEDEALLVRLEDQELLGELLRRMTAQKEGAPPAAAGMIALLTADDEGRAARTRALAGDFAPLEARIREAPLKGMAPPLLHHLALYLARVGDATESDVEACTQARVRSLAAWIALGDEHHYLAALAHVVLEDALPQPEVERALDSVALDVVDDLGRRAEAGARDRTPAGALALRVLWRVREACTMAGASEKLRSTLLPRARALRDAAVEIALAPITHALDEATHTGQMVERSLELLQPAIAVWRWAECDEEVERFVVDRLTETAWDLYRAARWDALRELMAPFEPLIESLCRRAERSGEIVAYRAACAQMLVFRSETAATLDTQLATAERALALCPGHRNARIVLASYLCHDATRRMNRLTKREVATIAALIERAETLNPSSRTLAEAKQRFAVYSKG